MSRTGQSRTEDSGSGAAMGPGDMVWLSTESREDTCRSPSYMSIRPRFGRDDSRSSRPP
jgi:hypothetical protein